MEAQTAPESPPPPRSRRRLWPRLLAAVAVPAAALAGLAWWLTPPLDSEPTGRLDTTPLGHGPAPKSAPADPRPAGPGAWPESPLAGEPAKVLLLAHLEAAAERLRGVAGYTARFRKHERVRGTLGPEQTIAMKIRREPFSVFFRYEAPKPGREVLYVAGKHDGKLIVHAGDVTSMIVPRIAVDPNGSLAMADNRHPITEAGLANLVEKLIHFRRMDLGSAEAETTLDRVADGGATWLRSVHHHSVRAPDRPFRDIEVLYHPATGLPHRITNRDWLEPGHTGESPLAERFTYDDVALDAPLSDADFDMNNPSYHFRRF